MYILYLCKGTTVIVFHCCGVPAIHLFANLYTMYCMYMEIDNK